MCLFVCVFVCPRVGRGGWVAEGGSRRVGRREEQQKKKSPKRISIDDLAEKSILQLASCNCNCRAATGESINKIFFSAGGANIFTSQIAGKCLDRKLL